jgi:hypothetical protein
MSDFQSGMCAGAGGLVVLSLLGWFVWYQVYSHGALPDESGQYGLAGDIGEASRCILEWVKVIGRSSNQVKIALHDATVKHFQKAVRLMAESRRDEARIQTMARRIAIAFKQCDDVADLLERFFGGFNAKVSQHYEERILQTHAEALLEADIGNKSTKEEEVRRQYLTALKGLLTEPDTLRIDGVAAMVEEVTKALGGKVKVAA